LKTHFIHSKIFGDSGFMGSLYSLRFAI